MVRNYCPALLAVAELETLIHDLVSRLSSKAHYAPWTFRCADYTTNGARRVLLPLLDFDRRTGRLTPDYRDLVIAVTLKKWFENASRAKRREKEVSGLDEYEEVIGDHDVAYTGILSADLMRSFWEDAQSQCGLSKVNAYILVRTSFDLQCGTDEIQEELFSLFDLALKEDAIRKRKSRLTLEHSCCQSARIDHFRENYRRAHEGEPLVEMSASPCKLRR